MDSAQATRSAHIFASAIQDYVTKGVGLEGADAWIRANVQDNHVLDALDWIMPLAMDFMDGVLNRRGFMLGVASEIQKSANRVIYAKAMARVANPSVKISNALKQDINRALVKAGMDGNKAWNRLGMALTAISEVLFKFGVTHDLMSADRFRGDDGRTRLGMDTYKESIIGEPEVNPINNSDLIITYHKFEHTGNWEVIAYVS
jgi:hypothetical protein